METFHEGSVFPIQEVRKEVIRKACVHIALQAAILLGFGGTAAAIERGMAWAHTPVHLWLLLLAGTAAWGVLALVPVVRRVFIPLGRFREQAFQAYLDQLPEQYVFARTIKHYEAYDIPGLTADVVIADGNGHDVLLEAVQATLPDDALPPYYLVLKGTNERIKHPFTGDILSSPEQPLILHATFFIKRAYLTRPARGSAKSE